MGKYVKSVKLVDLEGGHILHHEFLVMSGIFE